MHYYPRRAECTRYARISALLQLLPLPLCVAHRRASAWPPTSYLDSSPDKQTCSLTVRAFRQASTTRARGYLRIPATPGSRFRLGSGSRLRFGLPSLCTTRQLLSAGKQSWHRRLLHGITVKRAPLRAFPP